VARQQMPPLPLPHALQGCSTLFLLNHGDRVNTYGCSWLFFGYCIPDDLPMLINYFLCGTLH